MLLHKSRAVPPAATVTDGGTDKKALLSEIVTNVSPLGEPGQCYRAGGDNPGVRVVGVH